MKQIKTPVLRDFRSLNDLEINDLPSLTEAEQVQPLEKLLKHRMQGIPVPTFQGGYSDLDFPDFEKMDFSEIRELRELTKQEIEGLEEDFHRQTKALEKAQEEALKPPKPATLEDEPKP